MSATSPDIRRSTLLFLSILDKKPGPGSPGPDSCSRQGAMTKEGQVSDEGGGGDSSKK